MADCHAVKLMNKFFTPGLLHKRIVNIILQMKNGQFSNSATVFCLFYVAFHRETAAFFPAAFFDHGLSVNRRDK